MMLKPTFSFLLRVVDVIISFKWALHGILEILLKTIQMFLKGPLLKNGIAFRTTRRKQQAISGRKNKPLSVSYALSRYTRKELEKMTIFSSWNPFPSFSSTAKDS